jgi:hypothetical protein
LIEVSDSHGEIKSVVGGKRTGEKSEVSALRGIKGIYVLVERLPDAAKEIVSVDQLRTLIELQLRQYKIRVLTREQSFSEPGAPMLYLNLLVMKPEKYMYSYSYQLTLEQDVSLDRDPSFSLSTPTWGKKGAGYAGSAVALSAIQDSITEVVSNFINDFLAAQ